jgi:uncharacterized phage-associated protein
MIKLEPNRKKILEAILFLIESAHKEGEELTQYQIVKSVFIADLAHLRKFGRPITFDNYVAMEFGPVPSEAYDMLKPTYGYGSRLDQNWPPWELKKATQKAFKYINAKRAANKRRLSESDIAELAFAVRFVIDSGFGSIKDWTHALPAYKMAWQNNGNRRAYEMQYGLLIEGNDEDLVEELVYASKHQ